MKFFFDDSYEYIHRYREPYLGLHCIYGCSIKCFDTKVLLDPFEEKLHLPVTFVELNNSKRWESKIVGEECEISLPFHVEISNTSELFWVVF